MIESKPTGNNNDYDNTDNHNNDGTSNSDTDDNDNDTNHSKDFENDGKTALSACCSCGGGVEADPVLYNIYAQSPY